MLTEFDVWLLKGCANAQRRSRDLGLDATTLKGFDADLETRGLIERRLLTVLTVKGEQAMAEYRDRQHIDNRLQRLDTTVHRLLVWLVFAAIAATVAAGIGIFKAHH